MINKKKILDGLSPEEIVESQVLPADLSIDERQEAEIALAKIINKRREKRNIDHDLKFRSLQFKILLEDYINDDQYNPEYTSTFPKPTPHTNQRAHKTP